MEPKVNGEKTSRRQAAISDSAPELGNLVYGWMYPLIILVLIRYFFADKGRDWIVASRAIALYEMIQILSVISLPKIWHRFRPQYPSRQLCECFGGQITTLLATSFLIGRLASVRTFTTAEVPFVSLYADQKSVDELSFLVVFLGSYIISDTCRLLRTYRLEQNPIMIFHHLIFGLILSLGYIYPQPSEHYRIHFILFLAELSTPALNIRWMLQLIFRIRGLSEIIVGLIFFFLFTLTRIFLYGALIINLFQVRYELVFPTHMHDVFFAAVLCSYAINIYWHSKMVRVITKLLKGKKD